MGVAFVEQKVATRTLQLLFLPGKLATIGSLARHNREEGALKAQRKLAPRVIKARRNRNKGALKAQIQSAQGNTLGKRIRPTISAPCKGSYIDIKRLKNGNMELNRFHLGCDL
jgi:hypothetical protein